MMEDGAADTEKTLWRSPSNATNAAGGTAPSGPSPDASNEYSGTTTTHSSEIEAKSPAVTLLEYLFTSSFFEDVWEKVPLVVPHNAVPHNPFVGHRWIMEEDMICMCYRAAIAGTLKIFRQGVAYPPPNVRVPGPLVHHSRQGCSRRTPRSVSEAPPEREREGSCDGEKREDTAVNPDACTAAPKRPSPGDCQRGARVATTSLPDVELSDSDDDHAIKGSSEPESSDYLACVGPYLDGCSLVLNQADRTHAGLQKLCRTLAERLFTHVFAVAYLTPPSSYAVDIHTDDQDVFLLQIWGQKHWKVYAPPQELPLSEETLGKRERFSKDTGEPLLQFTLEEGDILYIPRGFPHEALTTNQNSLHITITVPTAEYAYINALTRYVKSLVLEHKLGPATEKYCRAALLPSLKKTEKSSGQCSEAGNRAKKATEEVVSLLKYEDVVDVLQNHLSNLRMRIHPSASTAIHQLATSPTLIEVAKLRCSDGFERLCVLLVLHKKGLIDVVGDSVPLGVAPCAREADPLVHWLHD